MSTAPSSLQRWSWIVVTAALLVMSVIGALQASGAWRTVWIVIAAFALVTESVFVATVRRPWPTDTSPHGHDHD